MSSPVTRHLIEVEHCGRTHQALWQAEMSLQHQIRAFFRALHGRESSQLRHVTHREDAASDPCSVLPDVADEEDQARDDTQHDHVPSSAATSVSQDRNHARAVTHCPPVPAWLRQRPRLKPPKRWDGAWHPEDLLPHEPGAQVLLEKWADMHAKVLAWEHSLAASVQQLPIWSDWCAHIRGVSAFGLGRLLYATTDLWHFPTVGKLWKYCGVGLWQGEIQRRKLGITQPEAEAIAYVAWRRAIVYNLQQGLLTQNKTCAGHPAQGCLLHPGPYRQIYLTRKEVEQGKIPEGTKIHWHRRASRYMGKCFLRDLWVAWRDCMPG